MARFSPSTTIEAPTRKYADAAIGYLPAKSRATRFVAAADDPLAALALEVTGKVGGASSGLTARGKPLGGVAIFGERRAPARRAAYRTPPR